MRRGFVRLLFGDHKRSLDKIYQEVRYVKQEPFQLENTKVICWGRASYNLLTDCGWDAVLMSESPYHYEMGQIFDSDGRHFANNMACGQFWRHKLLALEKATEFFDEFIMLDFDLMPGKRLPDDFWERFYAKESFQAALYVYHRRQLTWKEVDQRKVVSASFIYIRDRSIPKTLLKISNEYPEWREEIVLTSYVDQVLGNFPHTDDQIYNAMKFAEKHEPWCFVVPNGMAQNLGIKKDPCFIMRNTTRGRRVMVKL